VQDLPVGGVGVLADGLPDPALDPGELLVAGGQRPGGDQDGAQVLDGLSGRQPVELVVAERARASGERGERRPRGVFPEPGQHGAGALGIRERVAQRLKSRADLAAGTGQERVQLEPEAAADACPAGKTAAGAAGRTGSPQVGVHVRAGAAQRRLARPGADGGDLPAA
jgi:hypothetical protein